MYTPYLSHPDPTVKRKSGFLAPRYGNDSELGFLLEVPYYYNIAPDKDATVRPIITSKEGVVLAGEYRQRFAKGRIKFEGSATHDADEEENKQNRGHLFSEIRFDLTDTWRSGADIEYTSDDTYLRRYGFSSVDTLTTRLFVEGFRDRNYAAIQGYYWRGLSQGDSSGATPIVAPMLDFNAIGDAGPGGAHWSLDTNLTVLTRTNGTDGRRLSLRTGWELPHVARTGEVYRLYANLQTDAYLVDDVLEPGKSVIDPICVAPMLDFNAIGDAGPGGAHWSLDTNLTVLTRTNGTDGRRLSLRTGWELPHVARTGEVYRLYANLQTDAYLVDDVLEPGKSVGDLSSGFVGRIFPRVGLDWRYPFARSTGQTTQIIEPVAGIMLSPNGGNPDKIPNEDSLDIEFDDTNLLSRNRFTGLDRVEGGQRVYYGLQMGVYGSRGSGSAFIGQSYRFREDSTFAKNSGLEEHLSDIVGRVSIDPSIPAKIQYRFRLDKDKLTPRRNEVQADIGPPAFKISANYGFFGLGSGSGEFGNREELVAGFSSQLTKAWSIKASTRRDLEKSESLSHSATLQFVCDCFTMAIDFRRTFTVDRDVRPTDTIFVRLIFKNLGEVVTAAGP